MPKTLPELWEIAEDLRDRDAELRKMQARMDDMTNLEYSLPAPLDKFDWVRAVIVTAPYDAVSAGVRALSGLDERVRVDPVTVTKAVKGEDEAKRVANMWETTLKWQMDLAARRQGILREEGPRSALKYDEYCSQVIHLPTQIRAIESLGGDASRQRAALAGGQFAVPIRNPQNVHSRWSDYMLEAVLYVKVLEPQQVVDFWGDRAASLREKLDNGEAADEYVVYDYIDYGTRAVWAVPGEGEEWVGGYNAEKKDTVELLSDTWDKAFLPWSIVVGGTQMDPSPELQRFPLLYAVYRSEQWITANISRTLAMSQAIAEAGRPQIAVSGADPSAVETTYGEPGGRMEVPLGHTVQELQQRGLDPALREMGDMLESSIMSSTLPRILVTAEALPGEPFSGYNLRVQQALASLTRYKRLTERGVASVYRNMLLWCKDSGEPIVCKAQEKEYEIQPEDIVPESIHLEVELTPDVPLDRQQRVNTAIMMAQQLRYPMEKILEELGETDPQGAMRTYMKEQLTFAVHQARLMRVQAEASGELQRAAQQMAQGMAQQEMQQMAQQQQMSAMPPTGAEGMGQAFNPQAGGQPPAQLNPLANARGLRPGNTQAGAAPLGA